MDLGWCRTSTCYLLARRRGSAHVCLPEVTVEAWYVCRYVCIYGSNYRQHNLACTVSPLKCTTGAKTHPSMLWGAHTSSRGGGCSQYPYTSGIVKWLCWMCRLQTGRCAARISRLSEHEAVECGGRTHLRTPGSSALELSSTVHTTASSDSRLWGLRRTNMRPAAGGAAARRNDHTWEVTGVMASSCLSCQRWWH